MDQFSSSDLIYLYLDGEASSLQQDVLFSGLASNHELRQEFNDALHMSRAFREERSQLKPSLVLSSKVFAQAGITSHVEAATIGASVISFAAAWRQYVVPFSSFVVSALITYASLQFSSPNNNDGLSSSASSSASSFVRSANRDNIVADVSATVHSTDNYTAAHNQTSSQSQTKYGNADEQNRGEHRGELRDTQGSFADNVSQKLTEANNAARESKDEQ